MVKLNASPMETPVGQSLVIFLPVIEFPRQSKVTFSTFAMLMHELLSAISAQMLWFNNTSAFEVASALVQLEQESHCVEKAKGAKTENNNANEKIAVLFTRKPDKTLSSIVFKAFLKSQN